LTTEGSNGVTVGSEVEVRDVSDEPTDLQVRPGDEPPRTPGSARVIDLQQAADVDLGLDPVLQPYRTARILTSDVEILEARRLHASVYVANGFIAPEDVGPDGTIGAGKDPWPAVSCYFAVTRGGAVMATARQISIATPEELPALRRSGLDAIEVARILDRAPGAVVEISALAARRGSARSSDVTAVYVRMWQESIERRHRVWVMAVDQRLFVHLRNAFCGRAIRPIGPAQDYLGSIVVPAVVWCDELNPEQHRLARSATAAEPLRSLLPRLFPPPVGASR
jgi:hypothetical protein